MEKYYVLERFALMKTAVISTLDSMMLNVRALRKIRRITILKMHENCIRNLNRHENDYPIIF